MYNILITIRYIIIIISFLRVLILFCELFIAYWPKATILQSIVNVGKFLELVEYGDTFLLISIFKLSLEIL